jgi:pyridoxal phosphate enzyme (YggS family)
VETVAQHIQQIQQRIAAAAQRAGRAADDVLLVAVTKTVQPELIEQALAADANTFGESKVQEARQKIPLVSGRARWHMVGHLQTNKARDGVELFELIHSVDSVKLAAEISKWAGRAGKTQRVLLEINLSGESSKFGLKPDALDEALCQIRALPRLEVEGLMTVPPHTEEIENVRPWFRLLRELRDTAARRHDLALPHLSMGMTGDFEIAIEEGATMLRLGTAIFGERRKHEPEE